MLILTSVSIVALVKMMNSEYELDDFITNLTLVPFHAITQSDNPDNKQELFSLLDHYSVAKSINLISTDIFSTKITEPETYYSEIMDSNLPLFIASNITVERFICTEHSLKLLAKLNERWVNPEKSTIIIGPSDLVFYSPKKVNIQTIAFFVDQKTTQPKIKIVSSGKAKLLNKMKERLDRTAHTKEYQEVSLIDVARKKSNNLQNNLKQHPDFKLIRKQYRELLLRGY